MDRIERKGIAFDPAQLKEFDRTIKHMGYSNRSEAIRDLIRDFLIENKALHNKSFKGFATLTFLFDHHATDIMHNLTELQHKHNIVKTSTHIHIDKENCMEVLVLEGKIDDIENLSNKILATKGVKHGKLVLTGPFSR